MKVRTGDADRFAAAPPADIRALLFYGPDAGLVMERGKKAARAVVQDLSDPFRIAELSDADLKQEPARLADEAAQVAMTGGRRVVRVRGAGDMMTAALKSFLDDPHGDALIVVEAGDLGPRSSLRKLAETASIAAAIACYPDTPATLERAVREALAAENVDLDADALDWLLERMGGDRALTLREIEKLAIYAGPGGRLTLEDVRASAGDTSAMSLDGLIDAAAAGDLTALDTALAKAEAADLAPVQILIAASRHLQRLDWVLAAVKAGTGMDQALKSLRPPVHFSREKAVRRQLGLWTHETLTRALSELSNAEADAKTTGLPDRAVANRALLAIAATARRAERSLFR